MTLKQSPLKWNPVSRNTTVSHRITFYVPLVSPSRFQLAVSFSGGDASAAGSPHTIAFCKKSADISRLGRTIFGHSVQNSIKSGVWSVSGFDFSTLDNRPVAASGFRHESFGGSRGEAGSLKEQMEASQRRQLRRVQ